MLANPRTLQLKLQKSRYRSYTLQLFFTTVKIFSTVLYMSNNFHNNFFGKIVVKIFVVCEGLYTANVLRPLHTSCKHFSKKIGEKIVAHTKNC